MRLFIFITIICGFAVQTFAQSSVTQGKTDTLDALRIQYIARYKDYAMSEMIRSGVPASITLAQGILETAAGTSKLCKEANNHFGIKCGSNWAGATLYKNDDEYDSKGNLVKSCFRSYDSAEDNFSDHSLFLRDPRKMGRYGFLFTLDPLDYEQWAKGLQAAGYSPVNHYTSRLIEFIERYRLHDLDVMAMHERDAVTAATARRRIFRLNDAEVVFAREGETPALLAKLFGVAPATLLEYNDNQYQSNTVLKAGTTIYLELKSAEWLDQDEIMTNWLSQSTFDIAQRFGIRLDALRSMNNLKPGDEPAPGAKLRLRGSPLPGEAVALIGGKSKFKPVKIKAPSLDFPVVVNPSPYPLSFQNEAILQRTLSARPVFSNGSVAYTNKSVSVKQSAPLPILEFTNQEPVVTETDSTFVVEYTVPGSEQYFHMVRSGQTLTGLAREYNTTVESIQKLNNLYGSNIRAGQILRVK